MSAGAIGTAGLAGCSVLGGSGGGSSQVEIGAGPSDSVSHQVVLGIIDVLNEESENYEYQASAYSSSQGMERVANDQLEMTYAPYMNAYNLNHAEGPYSDNPPEYEIRQMFNMYFAHASLTTNVSEIRSVMDLPGHNISSGPSGAGLRQVFDEHMSLAIDTDDVDNSANNWPQMAQILSNGQVDASLDARLNYGLMPWWEDGYQSIDDLWLISWPSDIVDQVQNSDRLNGEYLQKDGPAFPNESAKAILGDRNEEWWPKLLYNWYTNNNVADDMVYETLEIIWNNRETIAEEHAYASSWTDTQQFTEMPTGIELSPGAEEFYSDEGVELNRN
jgi:TRAP-type uncharacterized transport system substrate-binding protein